MSDQNTEEQQVVVTGTPVAAGETKTVFGEINAPTPQWATWMFRAFLLLSSVALFVVTSDPSISDQAKISLGVYLKAADLLVFGFSKMFGIVPTEILKEKGL